MTCTIVWAQNLRRLCGQGAPLTSAEPVRLCDCSTSSRCSSASCTNTCPGRTPCTHTHTYHTHREVPALQTLPLAPTNKEVKSTVARPACALTLYCLPSSTSGHSGFFRTNPCISRDSQMDFAITSLPQYIFRIWSYVRHSHLRKHDVCCMMQAQASPTQWLSCKHSGVKPRPASVPDRPTTAAD